jgi:hypothetical protein
MSFLVLCVGVLRMPVRAMKSQVRSLFVPLLWLPFLNGCLRPTSILVYGTKNSFARITTTLAFDAYSWPYHWLGHPQTYHCVPAYVVSESIRQ